MHPAGTSFTTLRDAITYMESTRYILCKVNSLSVERHLIHVCHIRTILDTLTMNFHAVLGVHKLSSAEDQVLESR